MEKAIVLIFSLVSICILVSCSAAQSDSGSWRLDGIQVNKVYVTLSPGRKSEAVSTGQRVFESGWKLGGKAILATVTFTEVPEVIRTSSPYNFAAKLKFQTEPFNDSQPNLIFRWGFWYGSERQGSRLIGGKLPGTSEATVADSRNAYSMASSFGGPSDPRSTPGDFWETFQMRIEMGNLGITGDMRIEMHYKWMGPPIPAPACNMGNLWTGAPSRWKRRSGSNIFDIVNDSLYNPKPSPASTDAAVTLNFNDNYSFTGTGHTIGGLPDKECYYQGFVSGKEATFRAVMCDGFDTPIPGGLYIECDPPTP